MSTLVAELGSACEVTAVESTGIWLLVGDGEYFVPIADYPQFRQARLDQVFDVERISPDQVRWESLDVDIELAALAEPERFALVWR